MISKYARKNVGRVPLVSAIILNHNGLAYMGEAALKECLDSVIECEYPDLEVIFVDNGSSDKSLPFVEHNYRGTVAVVKNGRNLGIPEGFNTGIRVSTGKYLALLCNDMVVDRNWLGPIVKLMEMDRWIGVAGCKMLAYETRSIDFVGADLYLCGRVKIIGHGEVDAGQYDRNRYDLDFVGGAMIVRRSAIDQIGLLDSDFAIYQEDIDLCFRVRKAGYKVVYVFDSVLWHRRSATLGKMDRIFREYSGNKNRIRSNLIHFRVGRLFSAFLIDFVWLVIDPEPSGKRLLLKAYAWNIKHIAVTLNRRRERGPSPPYGCKHGLHLSFLSPLPRWIRKRHFS